MEQYKVTGMSCAACQARVEKAVSKVPGVTSCSVSLLTNSMGVEGTASSAEIIKAVKAAGYGASIKKDKGSAAQSSAASADEDLLKDKETPVMVKRLVASVVLLLPLMYISMGHMMWNWRLPSFMDGNHIAMGLTQLLLTTMIMVINQRFFISGFRSAAHGAPNMDTLVALGSAASYVYSVYALYAMTSAQLRGDTEAVMGYMHEFYFESAAMILTLITVGKLLEAISKGRTTDALKGLMKLAPKTAVVKRDGEEVTVPIEQVHKGDYFVVHPGDSIPVDGIIVCEATRVVEDTTLSRIIKMVGDASATKAPIAKVADKVSGVFVPVVIGIAVVTFIIWLLTGHAFGYALARAISVLVISCPCALGLATPVAIMVGNGVGAKHGIMFKTAVSLEETGKAKVVVLDKTGTITSGAPMITDVYPAAGVSREELLMKAYAIESKSEHPLAKAVIAGVENEESLLAKAKLLGTVEDFSAVPGSGLAGSLGGTGIYGGNAGFIENVLGKEGEPAVNALNEAVKVADSFSEEGKTALFFAEKDRLLGIIAVADVIKTDSPEAVRQLKNMGIHVVMLTGDNEKTARTIGTQAGVDEVIAGVLPDEKAEAVGRFKSRGKVIMVGDGINDAPALTSADIGLAIGAGTDIAIDAADVVLMKSRLSDVVTAIRLSRATLRNIHENLFWAFIYNIIGIPLAAGVWIQLFGWTLNPMFGAAAMSLSSFCVVTNALRLNLFKD